MGRIDDIALFVKVVQSGGLAAAGRQVGLSPASMTARIKGMEEVYKTRLLHRTTRSISLTQAGERFYQAGLRVVAELEQAESLLLSTEQSLSGGLRITAPVDFGRLYVAPALSDFAAAHPNVTPYLHLSDGVENLVDGRYDMAVRFGNLPDSSMVAKKIADNYRVLVASPDYLEKHGEPHTPEDLISHSCLVMERFGEPLRQWFFSFDEEPKQSIKINPSLTSNDGSVIRCWALEGRGIAYKSIWDVQQDLDAGRLKEILNNYSLGFQSADEKQTGLQIVYENRQYQPHQVAAFIKFFKLRING